MTDALLYTATFTGLALLAALLSRTFDRRAGAGFVLLFALYLGADDLVTELGSRLVPLGGDWNWSGKLCSLLLAALTIITLRIGPDASGLRWPQRRITASVLLTLALLIASVVLGLIFKPGAPSAETLAFQATMPGLAEELAYRGIAPALLLGLIGGKKPDGGVPWAVIVATAAMFGVWHGLSYGDGAYSIQWVPALYTFVGSLAYGWMRFATGSLLFPVLAHCLGNTVFQLSYLLPGGS